MMKFFRKLRSSEEGATAIEYGLIAALIAIALIVALSFIGTELGDLFNKVGSTLSEYS